MNDLLTQIVARFEAQLQAGYIKEYHDDEPTTLQRFVAAFVASQGVEVQQFTVGQPGKLVLSWQFDLYYCVPLADRRNAFIYLAQQTPLIIADWLRYGRATRLNGLARNVQVGQSGSRLQFVETTIAKVDVRALLVPLFVETETQV